MVLVTPIWEIPCAGPPFVAFPGSVLEEASSKEKKCVPHRSPDVTESCWHITARANVQHMYVRTVSLSQIIKLLLIG